MNGQFYILNRINDSSFDIIENKFFNNSWEPEYTEDKEELVIAMQENPERFINCEIIEH